MLSTLENLFKLARERKEKPVDGSYTNKLLSDKSLSKSKVLEEINELIEAVDKDTNKIHEAADVFYHLIIYLEANNIKIEDNGAGELLVTSMDRDGTQIGYDVDLMSTIASKVNIPLIASGGVGNLDHLVDGIKLGNASAVLAASIFHYGKHSVQEAKEYLDSKGIPVRI